MKMKNLKDYRIRRHRRLRQKLQGTAERPLMCVFVSNHHFYVQFVMIMPQDAGGCLDARKRIERAETERGNGPEAWRAGGPGGREKGVTALC